MKKYFTILFLFVSFFAFSQNAGINFQGVGRNASGIVLATQKISLRFSVIQGSETGSVEYVESKEVTTNAQGVFSVVIGDGTQISKTGNFTDINWKINPKFLKVEMDPAGGTTFTAMGTTRLQSVPFAYYANGVNADNVDGVLSASKGGTGVASITALKTALGVDQINNTSDLAKPISTAMQTALDLKASTMTLDLKENVANKSAATDLGGLNPSDILFPTQKAVKDYVTANAASGGIADGGVTSIKIANGAVGNNQLATNSINSTNIIDGTITNADINTNASIPFSKLNITKANIESLGIPGSDLNTTYTAGNGLTLSGTTFSVGTGAISSTSITDGTISNIDISNSAAIAFNKLSITQSDINGLGIPSNSDLISYSAGSGLNLNGTTFSVSSNVVTSTYSGAVTFNGPSLNVDNNSIFVDGTNHKVGIGTNTPSSKFEVNGASTNSTAYNASSGTTIDFALSNLAYTTASAGSFTLNNIKDGGTYTLAIQGTSSGTSSFTSTGFTFYSTNNGATTPNKQTLYTFIVMGSNVYYFMTTGF